MLKTMPIGEEHVLHAQEAVEQSFISNKRYKGRRLPDGIDSLDMCGHIIALALFSDTLVSVL